MLPCVILLEQVVDWAQTNQSRDSALARRELNEGVFCEGSLQGQQKLSLNTIISQLTSAEGRKHLKHLWLEAFCLHRRPPWRDRISLRLRNRRMCPWSAHSRTGLRKTACRSEGVDLLCKFGYPRVHAVNGPLDVHVMNSVLGTLFEGVSAYASGVRR